MIFERVGLLDLLTNVQVVCTTWWKVCKDPTMWRKIDMVNYGDGLYKLDCDEKKLCMHMVDRSDGELLDISIGRFADDELLHYISDRSGSFSIWSCTPCFCAFFSIVLRSVHRSIQLRCLEINTCYAISSEVFCEAVKKLPFLEELHLSDTYFSKEIIVVTGRYCPLLKSFKCNYNAVKWSEYDSVALAIAENMPQLRHLQLLKNRMTNEGLRAILDNCCHLESLDVRGCFNVDLTGDLGKRCRQKIKDLRPSNDDFAKDYYFDVFSWYSSYQEDNLSVF